MAGVPPADQFWPAGQFWLDGLKWHNCKGLGLNWLKKKFRTEFAQFFGNFPNKCFWHLQNLLSFRE